MVEVKKEGILLEKTCLGFENEGVLNPAIIQDGTKIHLFTGQSEKEIIPASVIAACMNL